MIGALLLIVGCGERLDTLDRRVSSLVWGGEQKLVASDAAELDNFGWSVALTRDTALVGAYGESNYRGAVYAFARNGGAWTEVQKLVASDGVELDKFGQSIALAGDRAVIGAHAAGASRGAAYVFVNNGSAWVEEQKLVASDGASSDDFGWSVALTADRALVGAYGGDGARGATYAYVRRGTVWTEEQKLVASDGVSGDQFGWSVALADDRALVGAPGTDALRGATHMFTRGGTGWIEEQKLVASDGVASDNFGTAVALDADRALVGAYWDDDLRGAAYFFGKADGAWIEEQKLVASDGLEGDRFGNAVSLAGGRALIGASGLGAAYVFARVGSTWTEEQRLLAGDQPVFDLFAWCVAFTRDQALVGASYTDQLRGAAYLFSLGVQAVDGGSVDVDAGYVDGAAQDGVSIDAGVPSCSRGDECASGHCEDGICCDRTCAASERCRAALKVAGEDGTCGQAKAAALGAPCSFDVQCTSGRCNDGVCADSGAPADATGTGGMTTIVSAGSPATDADIGGCACGTGPSRGDGPVSWLVLGLALLLARRVPGRRDSRTVPRIGAGAVPRVGGGERLPRARRRRRR